MVRSEFLSSVGSRPFMNRVCGCFRMGWAARFRNRDASCVIVDWVYNGSRPFAEWHNHSTPLPRSKMSQDRFQSTEWSVVLRAGMSPTEQSRAALEDLCRAYWYPLYAYCRRRGHAEADAENLVQGFFCYLIEHSVVGTADPERGRFRSFLLKSLSNFINQHWRSEHTLKRGGQVRILSLDQEDFEQQYQEALGEQGTPELFFERRWVETLMNRVIGQLRQHYVSADRTELFELLKPFLAGGVPKGEFASRLNMTEAAIAMALSRMRKRYGQVFRQMVAETLADPNDVEDELRRLMSVLADTRCAPKSSRDSTGSVMSHE